MVRLALQYAEFSRGVKASEQEALAFGKSVQDITDKVGGAFEGAGKKVVGALGGMAAAYVGIKSIDAFKNLVDGTISAAAGLKDFSEQTGASVESLSALIAVGKLSGASAEQITGAMNKLAKGLAVSNEESRGAAEALKALGINFGEFQALTPDEKIVALSKSMSNFADGSGKSAAAMALLGKSGAELLPYLKDLAEVGELSAKVTTEQAYQADEYEKAVKRAGAAGEAWKKQLALALLPAMTEVAQAFVQV